MQFNAYNSGGVSEKLIARYVHSGNSTVQASSVVLSTGVFTTTQPMSWTAGTIYSNIGVSYKTIPSKLFSEWNGSNAYGIQVIDANSFYIVNGSSSNAIVTYASGQTVDLTQFSFEYIMVSPPTIDLTKIKVGDSIRTATSGGRNRPGWTATQLNFSYSGGSSYKYFDTIDGRTFELFYYDQNWKYDRESGLFMGWGGKSTSATWNGGTSWSYSSGFDAARTFDFYVNLQFTSIGVSNGITNGTVTEVYSTF